MWDTSSTQHKACCPLLTFGLWISTQFFIFPVQNWRLRYFAFLFTYSFLLLGEFKSIALWYFIKAQHRYVVVSDAKHLVALYFHTMMDFPVKATIKNYSRIYVEFGRFCLYHKADRRLLFANGGRPPRYPIFPSALLHRAALSE